MTFQSTYDDEALRAAIARSHSWRGVLRELGLLATSAGSMRSARRRADRLCISYAHFTGQRRWSDERLAAAVAESQSWSAVARTLGLAGGSSMPALRGHALRLGLDHSHFNVPKGVASPDALIPDLAHLSRAGALLAAAWFEASGAAIAWPLEPHRYDLVAQTPSGLQRIQVKTTITTSRHTYVVSLATSSHSGPGRRVYDPDEIDEFFIIDGDMNLYRIPISVVAGLSAVNLSAYSAYRVAGFGRAPSDVAGNVGA